jgi:3-dehydroquinate synthase
MRTVNVALGGRSYAIHIGSGLLTRSDLIRPGLTSQRVVVITNNVVGPLHLATLLAALRRSDVAAQEIVLPDGEAHKNWERSTLFLMRFWHSGPSVPRR